MEPTRIDQTEFGPHGNCQSACLAMLLGIPIAEVPNFAALPGDDTEKYIAQARWLDERGWALVTIVKWQTLPWPPTKGYYIAGGESPRGMRHAVIYKDKHLWHDPHPERGGIKSVDDIDILYPLNASSMLRRAHLTEDQLFSALTLLTWRIEKCGASLDLTHAVTLCSDIRHASGNQWNQADKYAAERVLKAIAERR